MTNRKKQQKITTLFRKAATELPEECDGLREEIQHLEQQLREKQNELFQLQRNSYRHKQSPPKKRTGTFVRPQKIVLNNSIETLKKDLELMSVLTGTEVQSYVVDDHCCIVFHMQHDTEHELKHGLRIDTKSGVNKVSACSLPLGFNLTAVLDDYENMMLPESLNAIRKALVAYYNRLEQFQNLKKLLNVEAELFKTLDGSHMEISFYAQAEDDSEDDPFSVVLMLTYRVYDIRPKTYNIKEIGDPLIFRKSMVAKVVLLTTSGLPQPPRGPLQQKERMRRQNFP
ncbi:uncharacterized protein LOC113232851 isoform X2 [Hyposmocoma kahamanoa]|uniref:uncharacterized protein LOC113232851 isoform X2 n=1 Tax=Hyposmocoma kahamanoa TaxID=1477025 RepID=UPI000E6D6493|nr:uncharacterized protein LOC113232851 isoform X2 [Hyposmocoma kahamanoa]